MWTPSPFCSATCPSRGVFNDKRTVPGYGGSVCPRFAGQWVSVLGGSLCLSGASIVRIAPIVLSCLAWKPTDSGGFHFVCLEISPTKAALKTKHTSMTEAYIRAEINRNQPEAAVVKGLFG